MDARESDGYYFAQAYDESDLSNEEIFYVSIGTPDYIEEHEACIDEALEQNPDKMIFPTTLEDPGEVLDSAYDDDGSL